MIVNLNLNFTTNAAPHQNFASAFFLYLCLIDIQIKMRLDNNLAEEGILVLDRSLQCCTLADISDTIN